jgi:DNA (cytosine-5)-methyltransferase 1
MLNLLSWVDFLEPEFCIFENVRGFLSYSLNSVQESRYKVKGGIPIGGLKFTVRALVTMGYVDPLSLRVLFTYRLIAQIPSPI